MSHKGIDYRILLKRNGQTQGERMPKWLSPQLVPIDDRTKEEFFSYLKAIASQVHFHDVETLAVNGTWDDFFNLNATELDALANEAALPAHIALWQSFIHLYQHTQELGNNVTQRHLDFYYGEVLNLKKNDPKPDQTFVLFELKKNTTEQLITQGTVLLAGKDKTNKLLKYQLLNDLIVNNSAIAALQSLYVNPINKNFLHYAPIANSADGLGAELDVANPKWPPFGSKRMPLASIGFCLASKILQMKEGERTIKVELTLDKSELAANNPGTVPSLFKVNMTGEKGWIGPKTVSATAQSLNEGALKLSFTVQISADEPAVIDYDQAVHGHDLKTIYPILQVLINNENADFGYNTLSSFHLEDATLEVEVNGMTDLQLENDFGTLDPKKPFTPFGSSPEVNSNFTIRSEEVFTKRLKKFTINVDWKNIPASNLGSYFTAYGSGNANSDFTATAGFKDGYNWVEKSASVPLFDPSNAQLPTTWPFSSLASPEKQPVISLPPTTLNAYVYAGQSFAKQTNHSTFPLARASTPMGKITVEKAYITKNIESFLVAYSDRAQPYKEARRGQFQLRLRHSFLFKKFRTLYAAAVLDTKDPKTLPNEPFAPEILSLSLDYTATTAKTAFNGTNLNDFVDEEIEFFHYGAFGQKREHTYLKTQHPFVGDSKVRLLPEYENEGSFFIGITGSEAEDSLSLLFKAAEGSANPEKAKTEVLWSVLCDNYWKELGNEDFIIDTTNGLITSGIIKLVIPREATTANTIMPDGLLWFKASSRKDSDTVCLAMELHTNAGLVQFENEDNDPYHLAAPLAAQSLTKLDSAIGTIKTVKQPYASFGGIMKEDDPAYYTRISERLRHKERSVSNWDYERLILQHFPGIYKVKCINHASTTSFCQPGHLLLVVVPNLSNQNAVDPLKPRTDKTTLEDINTFVKAHSSPLITFHVSNPFYEPVQVSVRIKLKKGFEFNYYQKELDRELQQYLSPWLKNDAQNVNFGRKVTQSMLVQFLEDMEFIDFVSELWLSHSFDGGHSFVPNKTVVEASSPASVLVSHTHHTISNF